MTISEIVGRGLFVVTRARMGRTGSMMRNSCVTHRLMNVSFLRRARQMRDHVGRDRLEGLAYRMLRMGRDQRIRCIATLAQFAGDRHFAQKWHAQRLGEARATAMCEKFVPAPTLAT